MQISQFISKKPKLVPGGGGPGKKKRPPQQPVPSGGGKKKKERAQKKEAHLLKGERKEIKEAQNRDLGGKGDARVLSCEPPLGGEGGRDKSCWG